MNYQSWSNADCKAIEAASVAVSSGDADSAVGLLMARIDAARDPRKTRNLLLIARDFGLSQLLRHAYEARCLA